MRLLEKQIERKFAMLIESWAVRAGIQMVCNKNEVPGKAGYPDRVLLASPGLILFIEFKRPGGKLTAIQARVHEILREMGFSVEVYDELDRALEETKARIRAAQPASSRYADDSVQ